MKIKEFQEAIAKELNTLDELVQGGCKAFAEDSREVYKESDQHIQKGKIAVVVVTPDMQRNGDTPGALPAETQLLIQCSEKPTVARVQPGVMTALDAAEIVMHALDGSQFCWLSTRQTIDRQAGVLTATVTFATTIHLS
ncbi:MAG: hypothetical protein IJI73_04245 [Kiritimatiellae bacterium]|nr:hypothetical protein [Kiritimatiellia bacterium]MBQ6136563.1 hypothetical protein [Kiritimatiellia bacterium]